MKKLFIILLLFIVSCSMSNQEILNEISFCHKKDMSVRYVFFHRGHSLEGEVKSIICVPEQEETKNECKPCEEEIKKENNFEE